MDSEQVANQIVMRFLGSLPKEIVRGVPDDHIRALRNCFRDVLSVAARGEREACARLVEGLNSGSVPTVKDIAEAIRQRISAEEKQEQAKRKMEGTPAA